MPEITIQQAKEHLTKLKGKAISFDYLAKILGCSKQNLWQNQARILTSEQLRQLEQAENISFNNVNDNNLTVKAKYFTDVIGSCGSGCFEQSQKYEMVDLPVKLIENYSAYKEYSIINAYGDSMSPTIENADKLIIAHSDFKQIVDNKIYVFSYNDKIYIKRLVQNIDEVVVISDNENKEIYKTKVINQENIDKIYIIGQVIGIFRDLRG